jgi:hypothetical protein
MNYTLNFSNTSKLPITVTDFSSGSGVNIFDTSLTLVGQGYPNYGQAFDQDLLYLLENFSNSLPPDNPIEGQLWYDTSDPTNKILRINDGTASPNNWVKVSKIYQQNTDPLTQGAGLIPGDIWVDTANSLLNIFNGTAWVLVGPSVSGVLKTGSEIVELTELKTNNIRPVVLNWSNGYVVSVISSGAAFTPVTYPSGMQGFTVIKPGINLTTSLFGGVGAILNGTADNANKLGGSPSVNYLIKNDTGAGQAITGYVSFQTPTLATQPNPEGRNGVVISTIGDSSFTYVQFYKRNNDGIILNNIPGGTFIFQAKGSADTYTTPSLTVSSTGVVTSAVSTQNLNISNSYTPAGSSDVGTTGQIAWDNNYVYVCVATNTWKRAALTTW